jgi:hypothetical protein
MHVEPSLSEDGKIVRNFFSLFCSTVSTRVGLTAHIELRLQILEEFGCSSPSQLETLGGSKKISERTSIARLIVFIAQ